MKQIIKIYIVVIYTVPYRHSRVIDPHLTLVYTRVVWIPNFCIAMGTNIENFSNSIFSLGIHKGGNYNFIYLPFVSNSENVFFFLSITFIYLGVTLVSS